MNSQILHTALDHLDLMIEIPTFWCAAAPGVATVRCSSLSSSIFDGAFMTQFAKCGETLQRNPACHEFDMRRQCGVVAYDF